MNKTEKRKRGWGKKGNLCGRTNKNGEIRSKEICSLRSGSVVESLPHMCGFHSSTTHTHHVSHEIVLGMIVEGETIFQNASKTF